MKQLILFAALVHITTSIACADNYESFATGLKESDAVVNQMKFDTRVMYALNEATARDYFTRYFKHNRMTRALSANLGYPLVSWGNNHVNLQKGIAPALLGTTSEFFAKHRALTEMSKAMSDDPTLHNHIFFSLCHLVRVARANKLTKEDMQRLARQMFAIIKVSGLCNSRIKKIDQTKYHYVNSIKTQLLLTAFSFADRGEVIPEFAKSTGISGPRAQLLSQHKILVVDNGWFDNRQLKGIKDYTASMPTHLQLPIAMMCVGHTLSSENKEVSVHHFKATRAFNVFGTGIGAVASRSFPKNYDKTVKSDSFMIVLAHEYAHGVDSGYVNGNDNLKTFKLKLIEMAGHKQQNYLRSMIEEGYFVKHRNEFVASLANQYFSSAEDMLRLALQKAKQGNYNHINQFILMASLYSEGNKTYFYRINERGTVSRTAYDVKKKDDLLTELKVGNRNYHFVYNGGVIADLK